MLCAQLSVLSGFPTIWIVLVLIPRETESYYEFMAAIFVFAFGASWCTPACNRPVITEIVLPEVRGSILGESVVGDVQVRSFPDVCFCISLVSHCLTCCICLMIDWGFSTLSLSTRLLAGNRDSFLGLLGTSDRLPSHRGVWLHAKCQADRRDGCS